MTLPTSSPRPAVQAEPTAGPWELLLTRIDDASLGMIELKGPDWDRANEDHIAAIAEVRQAFVALAAQRDTLLSALHRARKDFERVIERTQIGSAAETAAEEAMARIDAVLSGLATPAPDDAPHPGTVRRADHG